MDYDARIYFCWFMKLIVFYFYDEIVIGSTLVTAVIEYTAWLTGNTDLLMSWIRWSTTHVCRHPVFALLTYTLQWRHISWASFRLKSPPTTFFVQQLVLATNKENIIAPHNRSPKEEYTDIEIPSQGASNFESWEWQLEEQNDFLPYPPLADFAVGTIYIRFFTFTACLIVVRSIFS